MRIYAAVPQAVRPMLEAVEVHELDQQPQRHLAAPPTEARLRADRFDSTERDSRLAMLTAASASLRAQADHPKNVASSDGLRGRDLIKSRAVPVLLAVAALAFERPTVGFRSAPWPAARWTTQAPGLRLAAVAATGPRPSRRPWRRSGSSARTASRSTSSTLVTWPGGAMTVAMTQTAPGRRSQRAGSPAWVTTCLGRCGRSWSGR